MMNSHFFTAVASYWMGDRCFFVLIKFIITITKIKAYLCVINLLGIPTRKLDNNFSFSNTNALEKNLFFGNI